VTGGANDQRVGNPSERTGVLVVRAWFEEGSPDVLRARVIRTIDVSARAELVTVVRGKDEVILAVQAWLDAFVGGGSPGRAHTD
jgi:hypothetical protein